MARISDIAARGAGGRRVDERLVDLQNVDWEASEVGQGRVARTEVVDGQPQAEFFEGVQLGDDFVDVVHQHALGDFQGQKAWVETGVGEDAADVGDEVEDRRVGAWRG